MKWKCKMYYPPSWSQNVHPSPIWLIRCTGAWCTTGISSGDKRCNAEIWGVNITCSISVLLFETSWCLQQTCSYTERHMLCEHCKDIQVTVEHIKVILVSAKGPARNLSSLILLKVQIISICWNVFTDVSADSHFGVYDIQSIQLEQVSIVVAIFDPLWFCDLLWHLQTERDQRPLLCFFFVCVVFFWRYEVKHHRQRRPEILKPPKHLYSTFSLLNMKTQSSCFLVAAVFIFIWLQ